MTDARHDNGRNDGKFVPGQTWFNAHSATTPTSPKRVARRQHPGPASHPHDHRTSPVRPQSNVAPCERSRSRQGVRFPTPQPRHRGLMTWEAWRRAIAAVPVRRVGPSRVLRAFVRVVGSERGRQAESTSDESAQPVGGLVGRFRLALSRLQMRVAAWIAPHSIPGSVGGGGLA